jgi:competence protein ComEA
VDLTGLNLARRLNDGELVIVGVTPPPNPAAPLDPGGGGGGGGRVNLNTASLAELDALPGLGPALAQRIIDFRTQHGIFRRIEDLQEVSGIGAATFARLKDGVTV